MISTSQGQQVIQTANGQQIIVQVSGENFTHIQSDKVIVEVWKKV